MSSPQPIPLHAAHCPHCRAVNDVAAANCIQCGNRLSHHRPAGLAPLWSESRSNEGGPAGRRLPLLSDVAANHPAAPDSIPPSDGTAEDANAPNPFDLSVRPDGSLAIRYSPWLEDTQAQHARGSAPPAADPRSLAVPEPRSTLTQQALYGSDMRDEAPPPAVPATPPLPAAPALPAVPVVRRDTPAPRRIAAVVDLAWAFAGGLVVATVLIVTGYQLYQLRADRPAPHVDAAAAGSVVAPGSDAPVALERVAPVSATARRAAPPIVVPPPAAPVPAVVPPSTTAAAPAHPPPPPVPAVAPPSTTAAPAHPPTPPVPTREAPVVRVATPPKAAVTPPPPAVTATPPSNACTPALTALGLCASDQPTRP